MVCLQKCVSNNSVQKCAKVCKSQCGKSVQRCECNNRQRMDAVHLLFLIPNSFSNRFPDFGPFSSFQCRLLSAKYTPYILHLTLAQPVMHYNPKIHQNTFNNEDSVLFLLQDTQMYFLFVKLLLSWKLRGAILRQIRSFF